MQMIQLNTAKFIHAIHLLTNEYGIEEDKNPFYLQYMSILSYLIARNAIIQQSCMVPIDHIQQCKDIKDVTRIDFFGVIEFDDENRVA